jgi:ATP/ADP translocase/HEAT repeat protein
VEGKPLARTVFGIPRAIAGRVGVATATLFGILAGHSVLETARDALFLSSLPASRLPWVYLAIAGLAVVVARVNSRVTARYSRRALLALTLFGSAVCTAGFWLWAGYGETSLYALYVWTGLIATLVVVQLWLLVADAFEPARAKRAFAVIGAGGLVGATFGSALAGAFLRVIDARDLVLVAAALMALSGVVPALAWRGPAAQEALPSRRPREEPEPEGLFAHPYLRRLLILVALTQVAVTSSDLLFKTAVVSLVDAEDLGSFLALVYTALNGLSLIVQVLVASWVLRRFGVGRALWALPVLLGLGAVGFALTAALAPILFLKLVDGSLRHSLHRTGIELLYLPLPARLRERHKVTIEAVGGRGGQAVAALAMLGALAFGLGLSRLAIVVVAFIVLLLLAVALVKTGYVDMFRDRLRDGTIETRASMPALDLHSLEALVGGLSSDEDAVVLSAIEILDASGRGNLVPPLILYHPSRAVVIRALDIMSARNRSDFVPPARRLLDARDEEVRTAALRALTAVGGPGEHATLRRALSDPSPPVRATALVGLIVSSGDATRFADEVRAVLAAPEREGRLALAQAIRRSPGPAFREILVQLAAIAEPDLQAEMAGIIAAAPDPSFLPLLLPMLGDRVARPDARTAMVAIGGPALAMLDHAMSDPALPRRLRMHLPRTVSRFGSQAAASVLSRHLEDERDEVVAHKILRGLGRLVAENDHIRTDPDVIERNLTAVLIRAITVLGWRLTIAEHMATTIPTPAGLLLVELLREKEETSTDRAFRLLGLLHPEEDVHAVYVGLRSADMHGVASGRGVVEHLVTGPMRDALLALVAHGDRDDRERLALAAPFAPPAADGLTGALRAMMLDPSDTVVGLAAHHIAELHPGDLTGQEGSELLSSLEQRTGSWIDAANQALLAMRAVEEPIAG